MSRKTFVFVRNRCVGFFGSAAFAYIAATQLLRADLDAFSVWFYGSILILCVVSGIWALRSFSVSFTDDRVRVRTSVRSVHYEIGEIEEMVAVPAMIVGKRRLALGIVTSGELKVWNDISDRPDRPGVVSRVIAEFMDRTGDCP